LLLAAREGAGGLALAFAQDREQVEQPFQLGMACSGGDVLTSEIKIFPHG
jgi:hypothetical protein